MSLNTDLTAADADAAAPTPAPPRPIRFWFRGELTQVQGEPATRSVLDWLRESRRCTGTKEGCNEGDCGACMVLVAERTPDASASAADLLRDGTGTPVQAAGQPIRLRAMNACLMFLPTLDGKALYTVEDLASLGASTGDGAGGGGGGDRGGDVDGHSHAPPTIPLHPAQQALVDCHGSQCGFCTPGFAVSLTAFYETQGQPGACPSSAEPLRQRLADALAGNLCRCTGYRPILDAGERMFELGGKRLDDTRLDRAWLADSLARLAADPPLHYRAPAVGQTEADTTSPSFHAPRSAAELAALRAEHPQSRLLGGATDVGLWVNKGFKALGDILHVSSAADLGRVETLVDAASGMPWLRIGAAVSLEDGWRALAGHWPELTELWRRFASPPVRHAGTLVGNLANGSPIGDTPPIALALGARLVLTSRDGERRLALQDFYLDYMKNALAPGEFVSHVELPLPQAASAGGSRHLRAWKISKRYDSDISALCAGFHLALDAAGTVSEVRLAYGGMAATAKRAAQAEAALLGQPWSAEAARAAMAALAQDFQPLSDLRATAAYRQTVAANLIWRLWLETGTPALAPAQTQVWAAAGRVPAASA